MPTLFIYALAMIFYWCFHCLFEKIYGHFQPWKKTLAARENTNLLSRAKICISKNMALIYYDFRKRLCFYFFYFCISHTNLWFHLQGVVIKKWFFHHFFCVYALLITMTKTETRDFVFIFLGNGLINNLIIVNCSEFI